jgi:hypothetical protein
MAILDTGYVVLGAEFLGQQNPAPLEAEIIPFPLNQELALGSYDGNTVFALGKTAIDCKHWLGVVRLGGFHLIISDIQRISGLYPDAIARQLALADELSIDNPGFTASLEDDIGQTRRLMTEGYLLQDRSVIDYVWLACRDARTDKRLAIHPDNESEHVASSVRRHTLQVARTVVGIY